MRRLLGCLFAVAFGMLAVPALDGAEAGLSPLGSRVFLYPHLEVEDSTFARFPMNTQEPAVSAQAQWAGSATGVSGVAVASASCLETVWRFDANPIMPTTWNGRPGWGSSSLDYPGLTQDIQVAEYALAMVFLRPGTELPVRAWESLLTLDVIVESGIIPGEGVVYAQGNDFPTVTSDANGSLITFRVGLKVLRQTWDTDASPLFHARMRLCSGDEQRGLRVDDFLLDNRPLQWNGIILSVDDPRGTSGLGVVRHNETVVVRAMWEPVFGPVDVAEDSIAIEIWNDSGRLNESDIEYKGARRVGSHHRGPMQVAASWWVPAGALDADTPWKVEVRASNLQQTFEWTNTQVYTAARFDGEAVPGAGASLAALATMLVAAALRRADVSRPRR